MNMDRRHFLGAAIGTAGFAGSAQGQEGAVSDEQLTKAMERPVLKKALFSSPVIIESVDLLTKDNQYIVRVRSHDGAVGLAVSNPDRMKFLYPIFTKRVAPCFIGKDARDLDALIEGVFIAMSNYKLQGMAFWVCVASAEFAILDLLGQVSGQSIGTLLGEVTHRDVEVYRASGNRGNTPEEEVAILQRHVQTYGAKAVKLKAGGRMRKDVDSLPGRTKGLIPLARKTLGDAITILVDSNGSYRVKKAIEIGRLCEANGVFFFEEPCPFDQLWETKAVADALDIPIAGGEQESSLRRFRWMIAHDAVQIVQPDLFYFGGYIRAIRVARMAAEKGLLCVPHMGGGTLGYLYVIHFASFVPNVGPFMEYKGKNDKVPYDCPTSSLDCVAGKLRVPTGPGFGLTFDPSFIGQCQIVKG